ncbi:MAG: saccharopine dehydrogenase C-terminal domain-containing protein [Candidatus Krumholzibacteriia bacterium]
MQKVLVLGAGLVARPLVRYLLDRGHAVTCLDQDAARAAAIVAGHPHGSAGTIDLAEAPTVAAHVAAADLVVSLAPPAFHPQVARHCLDAGRPMVTASYVSPEMAALDAEARRKGLVILNEIGVDPGLDHMSAMRVIGDVKARGGRVRAFRSYCGGLPAPQHNTNPFGYKFSWAPRGVLLASRNGASYLAGGRTVTVAPERLFRDMHVLQVPGFGDFEAYPNRDSLAYREIYGLDGIETLYRGTLRNMGWCDCFYHYRRLGLLDLDPVTVAGRTYADIMREHLGAGAGEDLRAAFARRAGLPADALPPANLQWLGLFDERKVTREATTRLDLLGDLMLEKLVFAPGEQDLIVLCHDFEAVFADGRREHITSRLIAFGEPGGDSAMSRTVSLPAAIGADLILQGRLTTPGVLRPVTAEIYEPVLAELATLNIACVEETETY